MKTNKVRLDLLVVHRNAGPVGITATTGRPALA